MNNQLIQQFAKRLEENDRKPLKQIKAIVEVCGVEFTELMVNNALLIHDDGGLPVMDGSRRRTLGGIFFYLVRGSLPYTVQRSIFHPNKEDLLKKSLHPDFQWEDRHDVFKDDYNYGEVSEVNITVKGRPNQIERRNKVVFVALEGVIGNEQTFPRGLPSPPAEPSKYFLYIGEQQWNKQKIDAALEDEETNLVADGVCLFDAELGGIAVFTRTIRVMKSAPKKEKPEKPEKPVSAQVEVEPQTERDEPDLTDVESEIVKKLRPLYGARRMFRKRLADIEALPQDKQSGLKVAQMMLQRTEQQISALETEAGIEGEPKEE